MSADRVVTAVVGSSNTANRDVIAACFASGMGPIHVNPSLRCHFNCQHKLLELALTGRQDCSGDVRSMLSFCYGRLNRHNVDESS